MANYTQPEDVIISQDSAYLDNRGRQVQMSVYNPLFKGDASSYISYALLGITSSLPISSSERTPTSSISLYSGSVFLLSGSAAFTCGLNLETPFSLKGPNIEFSSTTFTTSIALPVVDEEFDKRASEIELKGDDGEQYRYVNIIKGIQTSRFTKSTKIEGPLRITTGSIGTTRTGSLRIAKGATLRIIDGVNFNIKHGCTNPNAINYNPKAILDNGTCVLSYSGCTDPTAYNYNPGANIDDGSCGWFGCTDPRAINYDPKATINNGACHFAPVNGEIERQDYFGQDSNNSNSDVYKGKPKPRSLLKTRPKIIVTPNKTNYNNVKPILEKTTKGQNYVLSNTGEVYKGPYYTFRKKQLAKGSALLGVKAKGNNPLAVPIFKTADKLSPTNAILHLRNGDRVYADTNQAMSPALPPAYDLPTNGGQKCMNCSFFKNNNCSKWKAQVRQQYYCAAWLPPELLIHAGDTFRYYYPGIIQKGFYTEGNEFLLPNNKYYTGNYHILPNGNYKADVPFGTPLTLKSSLVLGTKKHFTKIFHLTNKNINQNINQNLTQIQVTSTDTQPIQEQAQTTTRTTSNASGTGTSYSY